MANKRFRPEVRKEIIIDAALALCVNGQTYQTISGEQVAEAIQVRRPTINHHFGTIGKMRKEVLRAALKRENLRVIAQGMAAGDVLLKDITPELYKRVMNETYVQTS